MPNGNKNFLKVEIINEERDKTSMLYDRIKKDAEIKYKLKKIRKLLSNLINR